MNFINGNDSILSIKVGELFYPIMCLDSDSFSEGIEILQTSTRDNPDGWKSHLPLKQNYSVGLTGFLESEENWDNNKYGYNYLTYLKRNRLLIEWGIDDGFHQRYGQGYLTEISDTAPIEEFSSFEGTISGSSVIRDTPFPMGETTPILTVVDNPVWRPEEFAVGFVNEGWPIYLAAHPENFTEGPPPDVTDFSVSINGVYNPPAQAFFQNNKFFVGVLLVITPTDVVTVQYTAGAIPLIINDIIMPSFPESPVINKVEL